jgi:glycosyltransferase involved in cell wall biosynthesis
MTHLFINGLSASAGGGLTYIRNVIPQFATRDDARVTLLVGDALRNEIVESDRITVVKEGFHSRVGSRFWREQSVLPKMIRKSGADVLLCPGNFALFHSRIPQILLSRNALYTSADFLRDLRQRGDYRLWIETKIKGALARRSISRVECTVAPSEAFAEELRRWTGKDVHCIHHGFDPESFFRESAPLPQHMVDQFSPDTDAVKVLFVSHYNYYRNFETLIRSIALVKKRLSKRRIRLILTCKLISQENPGSYRAETAAQLVRSLELEEEIIQLGAVPYSLLHHLYKTCDFYVTPAYAETFAHPLVEAMASGLPVVASDLPVHREICGEAAKYFPRFSSEILAEQIIELSECESGRAETKRAQMRNLGLQRSRVFQWSKHVDALLSLARRLASEKA